MREALNEMMRLVGDELRQEDRPEGISIKVPAGFDPPSLRVQVFFERVAGRSFGGHYGEALMLSRFVRVGSSRFRGSLLWVRVGGALQEIWNMTDPINGLLGSPSQGWGGFKEEHRLAALLALASQTESCRAFFDTPWWELQLMARLPEAPVAVEDKRHEGWVRYLLKSSGSAVRSSRNGSTLSDYRGVIGRVLMKAPRRGGGVLKPQSMPATFEGAEAKVRGLGEVDRAIDVEVRRLEALYEVFQMTTRITQQREATALIDKGLGSIMAHLSGAREVFWEGVPVKVSEVPVLPELRASAVEGGGLELSWSPPLRLVLEVGPGFVLSEGVIAPLSPRFPEAMRPLLSEPLSAIPCSDVPRFIESFALRCPIPLRLSRGDMSGVSSADRIEPRLFLSEEGDQLVIAARFGYHLGDRSAEASAEEGAPVIAVLQDEGHALVERDRGFEVGRIEALEAQLGVSLPARLEGEAAFDFLMEGLSGLSGRWTIYGERSLVRNKVVGSLLPSVQVSSGIDWFSLDVRFEAGGRDAALEAVLKAWLDGERYYRLAGGGVARLPRRWLSRHGEGLVELEELRKAAGGKLGAGAAPLAEGLLAEAPQREAAARWLGISKALRSFESIPEVELAAPIEAQLRGYQREGVRWLAFLRGAGLGGVLADDMGLGKTLQVLAILADTHARWPGRPSLVVAPASVVYNWEIEARRFAPSLRVAVHHGKGRGEALPEGVDVIVTSYNLMRLDSALFGALHLRYAVLDEAQQIKNPGSGISRKARGLKADHRLALTGTPMENNLHDLWSLFDFVMPGFFGTQVAFGRRYANPIQRDSDLEALRALRSRVRPFVLRRLKAEVAAELPPRQEQVLYCELGRRQRALYEGLREVYRDEVLEAVDEKGVRGATIKILEALTRLRQACCDARLLPMEEARGVKRSAKLDLLFERLEGLIEAGHRTLIFSQWPSLLRLVESGLEARGLGWLYLDGGTRDRQALVERWNDPAGPPVFLISLKAGGSGLNLTGADCVVHLDPWWNPAVEAQATDRAHRIGQTRPVISLKIVARDTVEEKILELQERKRALMASAIDADRVMVDALTRDDLVAVFAPDRART